MFIHSTNGKNVIVFKHLEIMYLNLLSAKEYRLLKEKFVIGLYFGGNYEGLIKHLPDFYICIPGLNEHLKPQLKSVPHLPLSGFNFLPDSQETSCKTKQSKEQKNCCDYVLYIGDFYPRKGIIDAIKFIRDDTLLKGVLLVRVSSYLEKVVAYLVQCILKFKLGDKITIKIPKYGLNHDRDFVFRKINRCTAIIMPYKNEGAARVFAEGEILGKPIIYNENMKGGTLQFQVLDENLRISEFTDEKLFALRPKNKHEKRKIYCSRYNTVVYENFLNTFFDLESKLDNNDLVNAFSGHRNEIPEQFTNPTDDQIDSVHSWRRFLKSQDLIYSPEALMRVGTIQNILMFTKQKIIKCRVYVKVLYEVSRS